MNMTSICCSRMYHKSYLNGSIVCNTVDSVIFRIHEKHPFIIGIVLSFAIHFQQAFVVVAV